VKEQLKKMGSFEYYQTSFSYTLKETGEEHFVGVPEQGGRDLISSDPLPPGTVYTRRHADGTVGLYRVEVSNSSGTASSSSAGGVSGAMKESVGRAFSYLNAKKNATRPRPRPRHHRPPRRGDRPPGNRVEAELGVAFFVAAILALRKCARRARRSSSSATSASRATSSRCAR
jgi:ATP-dependent Lon protease